MGSYGVEQNSATREEEKKCKTKGCQQWFWNDGLPTLGEGELE